MDADSPLFTRLRLIIARLRERHGGFLPPFTDPDDPYARIREPRPNRSPARGSAIALAEPDDRCSTVDAVGGTRRP